MLAQSLKLVGSLEPYRRVVLSADENFCRIEEGQDLGKMAADYPVDPIPPVSEARGQSYKNVRAIVKAVL